MNFISRFLPIIIFIHILFSPLTQVFSWGIDLEHLNYIDTVVNQAIAEKKLPGAVVLVGHDKEIVYHKAFGFRQVEPTQIPMTTDTIFDVASLTKVIVTTTLALQLVEQGKLRLSEKVATYIPAFGINDKKDITIEQLMLHQSGLADNLPREDYLQGKEEAFKRLYAQPLVYKPGTQFVYSCSNFIILGKIIEELAGKPLQTLAQEKIFEPLGMQDTGFLPETHPTWAGRIAPTSRQPDGTMLCGQVHDPRARLLGGVAGNAGLFSTASDLARFCKMFFDDDTPQILSILAVRRMLEPKITPKNEIRGLGWDIDSSYSLPRGDFFLPFPKFRLSLLPLPSFGLSGFTGVSIWIDCETDTYIIFLSNRLHPDEHGDVKDLRAKIASIVASALRN